MSSNASKIKIHNSLTKKKDVFKPRDQNNVIWYCCGPTVYDSSHLGHARCYLTFDIIKRILVNYFNFKVNLTMNVTDIDDKIIKKANQENIGFRELAQKYENEFFQDMSMLNIIPCDNIVRVSDHINCIAEYIKTIEKNGYAYRSNGSIYFDTMKFDGTEKHRYAKLVREAFGQKKALDEGEGELSSTQDYKRSPCDFALWKKSKEGEPKWDVEDFEPGRPGWHIECSAMASDKCGEFIDIHSGGIDLKFPHHDNEMAQAEAYYDTGKNWVNYFLHSGHLTIEGCKMSKSLKNFITIQDALKKYTSRQLRFLFLAHTWNQTLDFGTNTMDIALTYEKTFREFFFNLVLQMEERDHNGDQSDLCPELEDVLNEYKQKILMAISNNFDTRTTLINLTKLIKECNKRPQATINTLVKISQYIRDILGVFGTYFDEQPLDDVNSETIIKIGNDFDSLTRLAVEDTLFIALSDEFREQVLSVPFVNEFKYKLALLKNLAFYRSKVKSMSDKQEIMTACDQLRNDWLPKIGVKLEDRKDISPPFSLKFFG